MKVLFEGTGAMFPVATACFLFVLIAIIVDLISGIRKAKESKQEIRLTFFVRSWGLSISVSNLEHLDTMAR